MHAGANPRVGWASIFCLAASWRARPLGTKVMGCTQPEAIRVWAGWPLAASPLRHLGNAAGRENNWGG